MIEQLKYLETVSKNTANAYTYALKAFFKSIYGEGELEEQAEKYVSNNKNQESIIQNNIQNFFAEIKDRPNKTVNLYLSAVRTFLIENGIELRAQFWRRLRRRVRGNRAVTEDKVPSNAELRKIVTFLPVQGKALYLTLASSGMRIGEALKLTDDDVDLENDPPSIHIRGEYTKTGNKRISFITGEAKEMILEWLKIREAYIETAYKRSKTAVDKGYKPTKDDRFFPFTATTALLMWHNALDKAGFNGRDKSTKRRKMHPHVLRKFFRSQLGTVIPVDIAEALMGHEGYLTEVYRKYSDSEKTLADFYKKGEHVLRVFTESGEISKLSFKLEEQKKEIQDHEKQLQTILNGMVSENLSLKEGMRTLTKRIESLEHLYDKMFEMSPEEFGKLMQRASNVATQRQEQEDIRKAKEAWKKED